VDDKIVGQRIYLPNIVFRMIPNATGFIRPKQDRKANVHANQRNKPLAMEQYNPYIATFRVPAALNKMDIKGYLKAVYNLDTTFVATAIMHKTRYKADNGRGRWMNGKSKDNYKRAVVGLTKPFYYPNDPLGMEPEARMEYEEKLNTDFKTQLYRDAEVSMRRRQYNNVRNNIGLSERSAKIYQTTPDLSLKCVAPDPSLLAASVQQGPGFPRLTFLTPCLSLYRRKSKPAQLAEKDRVRKELADAVLREREAEARGEKSGKEDKEADAAEKTIPEGEIVEEEDWRSRR
jgi:ribosomal protein L23